MDRCRPTFAIETLEIIKHYFNIDNVIFVLGLDIEQLSYSIATIYGQNMDAIGYLTRFLDVIIKIPMPNTINYIKQKTWLNNYINDITQIVNFYKMSIRDINKFLLNLELFYEHYNNNIFLKEAFKSNIYLIAIKVKHPTDFKRLLTDNLNDTYNEESQIFPKAIWTSTFTDLVRGGNTVTLKEIINNPNTYGRQLRLLIDQDDISNENNSNVLLPIGLYIFNKIEMCVLDNNTQILNKKIKSKLNNYISSIKD